MKIQGRREKVRTEHALGLLGTAVMSTASDSSAWLVAGNRITSRPVEELLKKEKMIGNPLLLLGMMAFLTSLLVQSGELGSIDTTLRLESTHSFWTATPLALSTLMFIGLIMRTLEVPALLRETGPKSERNSLVVITDDPEILPELRRHLGDAFEISVATNENEIKSALERPALHAILFNLDAISEAPRDGLEVIEEIRKIRDDVVLAAFTRSNQRTIPLKASQAGTDEV